MTVHKFQDSLRVGKIGELAYLAANPHLTKLSGYKSDFVDESTNETYELKTDSYDMNKTANFFIEVFSDVDKGKPGGPIQAAEHGSTYWVYYFPKNGTAFKFRTADLVLWLKDYLLTVKPPVIFIQNKGWCTTGHKVPRELLKHLYVEERLK